MKNSGTKWCDKIPSDWQVLRLKYVMNNYDAQRMPVDAGKRSQNGDVLYDYYGASGVIDAIDGYTHTGRRILIGEDGANLVLRNLPLIYIADGKYWVNNHAHILAPKHGWSLDYFAHQMEAIDYFEYITGSAQPKLSQGNLDKVQLVVPPLDEQERIATFLNDKCAEIDALSSDIRSAIDTLEAYKQSVITEAVTKGLDKNAPMKDSESDWIGFIPDHWQVSRIGSLYDLRITKVNDRDYQPLSVTMNGVVLQLDSAAKTNAHDDRKLVRKGDFVINSRSDRRGACGISMMDGSVSLINTVLSPLNQMNPEYYNWLFHTAIFADEFYKWGHGIVDDLWTTGWQDMKRILIPYPPLKEQVGIAAYLNSKCSEIEEILSEKREQLSVLVKYKKSLIYEYVTGKKEVDAQ